ncbi:hypothetical protein [Chryseobacterium salipaludis]|uniref:hypothetical protein n=2 Tax=Chryseobacterium TaxID=59732 RepID=UPI00224ED3C2|nr:hypothetical protein [Planobacterium sp. JC490]
MMKPYLNTLASHHLPETIRWKLSQLFADDDIELIFFSREHLCPLPTLTVIAGAGTSHTRLQELQQQDWLRNSMEQHSLIITVSPHSSHAPEPDLPFSYIVLNCHPRHLIYARTEKSWASRFQNDYSGKQSKYEKLFITWQSSIESRCAVYHSQLIAPYSVAMNEEVVQAGLKAVYGELLSGFRAFFLPKSLHCFFTGTLILDFMQQHVPELKRALTKLEVPAIKRLINASVPEVAGMPNQQHLHYIQLLSDILRTNLAHLFYGKLRQTLSWNRYAALYLPAQPVTEKSAPDLRTALAETIRKQYKTQYIYWIPSKTRADQPCRYLLIMLGSSLKITQLHYVQQHLAAQFPELQISILLHKTDWIKKHYAVFYDFIDRHLRSEYLICYSRKTLSFPAKVEQERDGLVRRYWAERKKIIEVQWTSLGFSESAFTEGQVLYLRSIFQQLFLATLYYYAHYLPNTLNLNYLWELITWFAPELPQKIGLDRPMQDLLAFAGAPDQNFPNAEADEISTISFQEAVSCCTRLYEHLNNELS